MRVFLKFGFLVLALTAAFYLAEDRAPGSASAAPKALENYTETIPGTTVTFDMIAIPGGKFQMGSPEGVGESDEHPVHEVEIAPFWMAKTEVTWDEYEEFYFGFNPEGLEAERQAAVDAVTRPTPPYGAPDLGWGAGKRPAMSMTFHAAQTYVEWISALTGKKYRLPTEAEWEYACRAGDQNWTPDNLDEHAWFLDNSEKMSYEAATKKANPFGLFDMLGNVSEFCSDWYAEDYYAKSPASNPQGPDSGSDRVVRGGSYLDPAEVLRPTNRMSTTLDACLVTDPQVPKSIWWYSDCFNIGIRVVRSAE